MVVPVAFHVSYLVRFATPTYTKRQYQYTDTGNLSRVYTPAFLVNSREWQWRFESDTINSGTNIRTGNLKLTLSTNSIVATFSPMRRLRKNLNLQVTILGFELNHDVTSGGNKGTTLNHEFVVVGYWKKQMTYHNGKYYIEDLLPNVSNSNAKKQAIAARVSGKGRMDSLQVVGGWLTDQEQKEH